MPYFLAPFIGWLVSGTLKYLINRIRFGEEAKQRIGNGGFPSTHTTTVVTPTMLVGFELGFSGPIFGIAVAFTFIILLDAIGLRFAVGNHATILNQLIQGTQKREKLRESMGHTPVEVLGGITLGSLLGWLLSYIY